MTTKELIEFKNILQGEEDIAHIKGWDFSHIEGRFKSCEKELPWDYKKVVMEYLKPDNKILDIDTGGGEFLLSLNHPYDLTSVTEGYAPNVKLCRERLGSLGIKVFEVTDCSKMPFDDCEFDIILDRHGEYNANEIYRILKPNGIFITQQVGEDNDRELIDLLLPGSTKPFPGMNLKVQRDVFTNAGFKILKEDEAFRPINFYDVGALAWFARIIEWEFVDFSVDRCFEQLLKAKEILDSTGKIQGRVHRYMLVVQK